LKGGQERRHRIFPSLRHRRCPSPSGGFMEMPATGKASDMRVIDMYRRSGDKLPENWIFIDLPHFWNQQGVDVLNRMNKTPRT